MSEDRIVTFEQSGRVTIGLIEAASVLDAVNVSQFGAEVIEYVQAHPGVNLLLDFEHVDYLSSAVLTELLRIHKAVEDGKGALRLCSVNRDIRKVFEITNLDQMFVLYDDSKSAVRKFQRSLDIEAEEDAWGRVNNKDT